MSEPSTVSIGAWMLFGAFLNSVFGVTQQSVTVALVGTAMWALIFADTSSDKALPRWKFWLVTALAVIGSAIVATAVAAFYTWSAPVLNGLIFALSIGGPYTYQKVPGWIDLFIQKWSR